MQGVLAGRYRLERQLGKGGMGSVWLAEHLALRSWVAVKLMDPAIAATAEGAERFRREAQAAASLRSAHVVQVLDYGVDAATPYLVMELLQGESLASCLEREKRLSPERTVAIITQVARALGRAHSAGIVHRDLKPDNVFLVREDDQELVKILDFGIAKTPKSQFGGMETRTGVTMGTPYYMSPEQVEGKKELDFRTDLWAMAVIACECMTGVRPFDGSTFGELLLNICARPIPTPSSQGLQLRGFDEWFAKATSRDPEQRFASAQELAGSLKDVVAAASGQPPAPAFGQVGYAPAATVNASAGSATASSLPSVSSTDDGQPLGVPRRSSALPWVLVAALVVTGGVILALLSLRAKPGLVAAEASSGLPAAPTRAPSVAVALAPPPTDSAGSEAGVSKTISRRPASDSLKAASVAPTSPRVATTAPTSAAPAPASGSLTSKALRCFSDPFSGQLRAVSPGRSVDVATFACTQDPFTGKLKKL